MGYDFRLMPLNACANPLAGESDRVLEHGNALALARNAPPGPSRMLNRVDEPLGVGHEAEDQAAVIANAGDVVDAAVGVVWERTACKRAVSAGVGQGDLIVIPKRAPHGL